MYILFCTIPANSNPTPFLFPTNGFGEPSATKYPLIIRYHPICLVPVRVWLFSPVGRTTKCTPFAANTIQDETSVRAFSSSSSLWQLIAYAGIDPVGHREMRRGADLRLTSNEKLSELANRSIWPATAPRINRLISTGFGATCQRSRSVCKECDGGENNGPRAAKGPNGSFTEEEESTDFARLLFRPKVIYVSLIAETEVPGRKLRLVRRCGHCSDDSGQGSRDERDEKHHLWLSASN